MTHEMSPHSARANDWLHGAVEIQPVGDCWKGQFDARLEFYWVETMHSAGAWLISSLTLWEWCRHFFTLRECRGMVPDCLSAGPWAWTVLFSRGGWQRSALLGGTLIRGTEGQECEERNGDHGRGKNKNAFTPKAVEANVPRWDRRRKGA